jgi:DNA-binding beta-propeller fold protein YncE
LVLLAVPQAVSADLQQSERSGAELRASFQYLLSDFSGPVRSQWARLAFDPVHQEIYTLTQGLNEVRIFNRQGMEIFAFGGEGDIVSAVDIAAGENGSIYVLARNFQKHAIQLLNFRGEPESNVSLKGLPKEFKSFRPDRMEYRNGRLYLLDSRSLRIVVILTDGTFVREHDLAGEFYRVADELDPDKKKSLELEISGFSVADDGCLYFTAPTLFSAFRLNRDASLDGFGRSGSGPGKFGIVSGIVADEQGNIYVADRLRSVVMIFDRKFVFQGEFGYRGDKPEDLIVPDELVIDTMGNRIFVSQAANKGVGVYSVSLAR